MSKTEPSVHILRKIVVDGILFCAVVLALCAQVFLWEPFKRGFFCNDESLQYPYLPDTVNIRVLRFLQIIPIVFIFFGEWVHLRKETTGPRCLGIQIPVWVQSFYCVAVSFALGTCFNELTVNLTKSVIGRPRPYFFNFCKPSVNCSDPENVGRYFSHEEFQCTANLDNKDAINNSQLSFLSGHSAVTAFAMIFLVLYLEKRMTWRGTRLLRHTVQFVAFLTSVYVPLSRVSDYHHHWSDVLAGFLLGVFLAICTFFFGTEFINKNSHDSPTQMDVTLVSHQQMAVS